MAGARSRLRPVWPGLRLPAGLGLPALVTLARCCSAACPSSAWSPPPSRRAGTSRPTRRWPRSAAARRSARRSHTLETASLSALGALLVGGTVALALGVTDVRGKRPLAFAFVFSMMIAPQVAALAFLSLFAPHSPMLSLIGLSPAPGTPNPLLGRGGIILVMALHHAPLVAITLWTGLRSIPHSLVEAAQMEGAGPATIVDAHPAARAAAADHRRRAARLRRRRRQFRHSGAARPAGELSDAADADLPAAVELRPGRADRCGGARRSWSRSSPGSASPPACWRRGAAGGKVEIERPLQPFWALGGAGGRSSPAALWIAARAEARPALPGAARRGADAGARRGALLAEPDLRQVRRGAAAAGRDGAGLPQLLPVRRQRGARSWRSSRSPSPMRWSGAWAGSGASSSS